MKSNIKIIYVNLKTKEVAMLIVKLKNIQKCNNTNYIILDFFNRFHLQWFSRTFVILVPYRTAPYRTVPYRTKLKLFFKNSLGTFDVPYFRTIIKNLELFLKTRIFLKKYHKLMRFLGYFMVFFQKNPSF